MSTPSPAGPGFPGKALRMPGSLPLLYSLTSETRVQDGGHGTLYQSTKVSQWAVQDGLKLALWAGYEF